METHGEYYMGDKFYYRIGLLDGLPCRFFIYDLREGMDEQIDFIYRHGINSFSFTGDHLPSLSANDQEDIFNDFLTLMDRLPANAISLNLTYFESYDNLNFLQRFSDCRKLEIHCTLNNYFDFRVLKELSHVTLWYGKNFESILQCPGLKSLCIFKPDRKALLHIGGLEFLRILSIRQTHVKSIEPLTRLHRLESLQLRYLPKFTEIAPLASLKNLRDALFQNCIHVEDWNALEDFPNLESLVLENCGKVEISEALEQRLQHLHFVGSSQR